MEDNLSSLLDRYKIPLLLSLVGVVLIIGGIISSKTLEKPKKYPKESMIEGVQKSLEIKADISGGVILPGVYVLRPDSRIEDAVKIAGGFSDSANKEYISKNINLSQKVTDGMKIYIPLMGDKTNPVPNQTNKPPTVHINSASQAEIESLPGVGPTTAAKIIQGRPYNDLAELITKKAVSKSVFEKIKTVIDLN